MILTAPSIIRSESMAAGKSEIGRGQQRIKGIGASLRNLFGADKPAPAAAPATAPNTRIQLREQLSEIGAT